MTTTNDRPVRALSVRQPWASWLIAGAKPVENRVWAVRYRGLVVIHAGKSIDPAGIAFASEHDVDLPDPMPTGAYLGTVRFVDVHLAAPCCQPWGQSSGDRDVYHWTIADPQPFDQPIPGRGRLGLYLPPNVVLTTVRDHHTEGTDNS